jgi:hypothetical protein
MDPDPEGPKTCGSGTSESGFWSGSATLQVKKSQDITNFDWTEAEKYCHFYAMPSVGISQINHFFNDCWHIASEINHIHLKINKHASHPFTPAQWILLRSVLLYPSPMHQHEKSFYAPLFEICRSFRVNADVSTSIPLSVLTYYSKKKLCGINYIK